MWTITLAARRVPERNSTAEESNLGGMLDVIVPPLGIAPWDDETNGELARAVPRFTPRLLDPAWGCLPIGWVDKDTLPGPALRRAVILLREIPRELRVIQRCRRVEREIELRVNQIEEAPGGCPVLPL